MYKLLLILKYLRRKLIPLFAALAVMLCTAMVIIVISVMGGFLVMLRDASHTLSGDVTITSFDLNGFGDYEEMLKGLRTLPDVQAATPMIQSLGLLTIEHNIPRPPQVVGIEPESMDAVLNFRDTLYWTSQRIRQDIMAQARVDYGKNSQESQWPASVVSRLERLGKMDFRQYAMDLKPPPSKGKQLPGIVVGVALPPSSVRDERGNYHFQDSSVGEVVTLAVVPLTLEGGTENPAVRKFEVVNEFKTGLYEADSGRVYIPLQLLQKMLKWEATDEVDMDTGQKTGRKISGRVSEIAVRGKPNVDLAQLQAHVRAFVDKFTQDRGSPPLDVETWEEMNSTFLGAVEKEKGMLTILFAFISVVAVAMIGVVFYMIVLEKTRDIGVLRAIGASRTGIMSIFLGYGLAIGTLGSGLGLALAATVVWNLNGIQDLLYKFFGFKMWDPRIYYFDRIPSQLNPHEVTIILIVAAISGIVGSLLPAFLAGRLNPVEALRYE